MGCNCKKKTEPVEVKPQELPTQLTKEEIDWFNNIDTVNPIPQTPDELLAQELKKWNGGYPTNENNG